MISLALLCLLLRDRCVRRNCRDRRIRLVLREEEEVTNLKYCFYFKYSTVSTGFPLDRTDDPFRSIVPMIRSVRSVVLVFGRTCTAPMKSPNECNNRESKLEVVCILPRGRLLLQPMGTVTLTLTCLIVYE